MRAALPRPHRFTVEDFHRMGEAGILGPDERVELLDGQVINMAAIGSRHAACVKRINLLLVERFGRELTVGVQDPAWIDPHSELIPDITVLRHRDDFYEQAHPRPEDVLLLIEVSDTTLGYDRHDKLPVYADAGIAEVWLVNLRDRCVEVFRDPTPGAGYRDVTTVGESGRVEATTLADLSVEAREILG